jgi:hypothetical protein
LPSVAVICKIPTLYNQHFFLHITVASTSINPVTLKTGSKFPQNVKTFNHYTQKTIIRTFIQFRWYHQSLCSKWHHSLCDTQSCINMWIAGPILKSESYHSSLQPSSYEWVLHSTVHPTTLLYQDSNLNKLCDSNK